MVLDIYQDMPYYIDVRGNQATDKLRGKKKMWIEYEIHHRMTVEGKRGYWTIKQDCYPKDEAEAMRIMNALKSAFPEVEYRVCKITREIIGA